MEIIYRVYDDVPIYWKGRGLLNNYNILPGDLHVGNREPYDKKLGSVQKGASSKAAATWTGGAYEGVRDQGQGARTPLAAFFNTPRRKMDVMEQGHVD